MQQESFGLLGSVKRLLSSGVSVVSTRLELLANEWEEERLRLAQMLLFSMAALFFLATGMLLLVALVVMIFWDEHRLAAVGILSLLFLLAGGGMVVLVNSLLTRGTKLFSASLEELSRDRELLGERHE
jgi:uncharacterized membrane protein YqjE